MKFAETWPGIVRAVAGYWLAQVNVARPVAPVESPELADFVANLEPINALADAAPGFVWRLQTEDGNATAIRVLGTDMLMINMSLWESLDALADFVYDSDHLQVMRRRREWFERMAEAYLVLWWVEADQIPSIADAEERLVYLRQFGPTPHAFTFRDSYPAPDGTGKDNRPASDPWSCPTG